MRRWLAAQDPVPLLPLAVGSAATRAADTPRR
jgi:hypothetical protein